MGNTLITTIGMSPQIVTETWEKITHEENITINEVVTFHTADSAVVGHIKELEQQLLDKKIKFTSIPLEFNDVTGLEENSQFINAVFSELWKRSMRKESLYVSIAGGRKTMSALLYWIAELVGAKSITHVLVSKEIEQSKVFFPPLNKLNLVKLDAINLFPTISHLCSVNKIDLYNPDKVWKVVKDLPNLLPGLMENAVHDIFPTAADELDFEGLKELKERINREIKAKPTAHLLLFGETGVGKEYMAKYVNNITPLHKETRRPLIPINCSILSPQLAASELFGHKKGAFTGALTNKMGKIELAKDGDLFLDEIGDLSIEIQPLLLRLIQYGEYEPLGGEISKINTRIIAATNKPLAALREDLYHRFPFVYKIPPIRERPADIKKFVNATLSRKKKSINKDAMSILLNYNWPGNFRQLDNVLIRAISSSNESDIVSINAIAKEIEESNQYFPTNALWEDEKTKIKKALQDSNGKVMIAAKKLNIGLSTLYGKMKQHGIKKHK